MAVTQSDVEQDVESSGETESETVYVKTSPAVQPTVVRLGVVVALTALVGAFLRLNPTVLGEPEVTNTAAIVVTLIGFVLFVRYLVRILIIRRTEYVITNRRIERRYELFYRVHSNGARFEQLRSHELTQSRVQSAFGLGTIHLNRGLGSVRLADVPEPDEVYATVRAGARGTERT